MITLVKHAYTFCKVFFILQDIFCKIVQGFYENFHARNFKNTSQILQQDRKIFEEFLNKTSGDMKNFNLFVHKFFLIFLKFWITGQYEKVLKNFHDFCLTIWSV